MKRGEKDDNSLWKTAENLCRKFSIAGKDCLFLAADRENRLVQSRGTEAGCHFIATYPEWTNKFQDFCVKYKSSTEKEPVVITVDDNDDDVALPLAGLSDDGNDIGDDDTNDYDVQKITETKERKRSRIKSVAKNTKVSSKDQSHGDSRTTRGKQNKKPNLDLKESEQSSNMVTRRRTIQTRSSVKLEDENKSQNDVSTRKTNTGKTDQNESLCHVKSEVNISEEIKESFLLEGQEGSVKMTPSDDPSIKSCMGSKTKASRKTRSKAEEKLGKLHPDLMELRKYLNRVAYSCKVCPKEFDNSVSYYNHIRSHTDYQHCKICDTMIKYGGIDKHLQEDHICDSMFKCFKCEKQFKSKLGLKSHFMVHHVDKNLSFKCRFCETQCGSKQSLKRHENIHEFENSCFICLKKIETKEKLKEHMKESHGFYLCMTCSLYFVDNSTLIEHEQNHINSTSTLNPDTNSASFDSKETHPNTSYSHEKTEDKFDLQIDESVVLNESLKAEINETKEETNPMITCSILGKTETSPKEFLPQDTKDLVIELMQENQATIAKIETKLGEVDQGQEIMINTKDQSEENGKSKACKFCGKQFKHGSALLRHLKLHNNKSTFTCDHCGKISKTDETYKRHMIMHLPNDEKPYKCDICGKGFATRTNLNIHAVVHNDKNQFMCEFCAKGFRDPRRLKIHRRSHTGEYPYECPDCGKKFRSWDMLDNHKIVHKPKSNVICDICGKFFAHRLRLQAHKRTHDKIGKHKCSLCESRFKTSSNLHSHYIAMHVEYAQKRGWRMHECKHCNKLLATKERLRRHLRTHTGDRPFECSVCGKCFTENGNLNAHMKIHTNDKQYQCPKCFKSFIHNRTLKKHMLVHETPKTNTQEKITVESVSKGNRYTNDELLAISIMSGTDNYVVATNQHGSLFGNNAYSQTLHTINPPDNVSETPIRPVRYHDFHASTVPNTSGEYLDLQQENTKFVINALQIDSVHNTGQELGQQPTDVSVDSSSVQQNDGVCQNKFKFVYS